ncbi:MAG: DegT/DnrJ/EryC1/StrS family aminotransferase [Candidatus Accumulibacter sp.]|uniref:DegT/DnrJ/EryC1/StrS family aminotransferase n=1 Tax=Accumulibacter sp. TaxID=2053492 RepID=UPI001AC821B3|nr:DegT/DnrJ/EryC1/StrS family aminotransferase [Accumulibacter sp.]MBN8438408.1 DegT/DnrJ/EryC1/StrS family aminotransferase [Accumulibacter sp.]
MIPVNEPLLDGNEKKYLVECIDSGWISSEGPFVTRFENEFAAATGRRFGVAVCNGTAAIDAAMEALGIGPGDEVIMPAFTIISCIAQIVRCGARAVLVDSDPLTWNMDVTQIEARITARTRAIMIVHVYGLPVDVDSVLDIARRHGLKVIEDAAEMHGQTCSGRACGSFGDISTFSFYPNKHITTGEGGMIVTDDDSLATTCRSLRNLCFEPQRRFVHERLGWNLRMSNLQAAVGVAQLERLPEFVARKRRMGALYRELLDDLPGVQLPLARTDYAENIYWVFGLVLDDGHPLDAPAAMRRLTDEGIGCRPFFCPMHEQPFLKDFGWFDGERYPVAERLYRRGFYIPSGMALTEEQIATVATVVRKMLS